MLVNQKLTDKQKQILTDLMKEGLQFWCPQGCSPDVWHELRCFYCNQEKVIRRILSDEEFGDLKESLRNRTD